VVTADVTLTTAKGAENSNWGSSGRWP